MWRLTTLLLVAASLFGCGASSDSAGARNTTASVPSTDDLEDQVAQSQVHVRFEVAPSGKLEFGSVPFPDDLYRDADGHLAWSGMWESGASADWVDALSDGLAELDGFGLNGPIFFGLDGELDPASLPADPPASLGPKASVFVLDIDTNSSETFTRVPVNVRWEKKGRILEIAPAEGHLFAPRRRYAAVVTRRVRDTKKQPVGASLDFLRARYLELVADNERLQRANENYGPIFDALEQRGTAREDVVGLAVFRVQSVLSEMQQAAELISATETDGLSVTTQVSGDDLDALLGSSLADLSDTKALAEGQDAVATVHANVAELIQGKMASPQLASATATAHGAFVRDASGMLMVKRIEDVPFTLILPRDPPGEAPLPVVVFAHGAGGDRSDALLVADRFAAVGMAVVALDAPFHGQRAGLGDMVNRFTGEATPDGFGDATGDFYGMDDDQGDLVAGHPFYYRDAVRQGALDILNFLALSRQFGEDLTATPLDFTRVALVGVDVGATMGMMVAALDEGVELIAAVFSGGPLVADWCMSPAQSDRVDQLLSRFGVKTRVEHLERRPDISVYQALLDRADPLAWAALLQRAPVNALMLMATGDEVVSNDATEALASVLGAPSMYALDDVTLIEGVTRDLLDLGKATHGAYYFATDNRYYEASPTLPFAPLAKPMVVNNPVSKAQDYVVRFVESWRACIQSSATGAPCSAQVPLAL